MNCKEGDFARIVAPYASWGRGYWVTVVRPARANEVINGAHFTCTDFGPGWVCDGRVPDGLGGWNNGLVVADNCLRPLRGEKGDESFVTEARKSLTITKQNDKLKKVAA